MGRDKLLLAWDDTVVLGSVLDALEIGGADPVVVVVAPQNRRVRAWLAERAAQATINPRPERGMLSSVVEGLEELGGGERLAAERTGLLVCPGDHAGLLPATVRRLRRSLDEGARLAVPVHAGRRGHPLAIAASLAPQIEDLDPAIGLRQLVARHAAELVEIAVEDPAVTRDLDSPADYREAIGEH